MIADTVTSTRLPLVIPHQCATVPGGVAAAPGISPNRSTAMIWKEHPTAMARVEILWAEGRTTRQIANIISVEFRLPVTKNSIVGIVHRMGLPSRVSPIIRDFENRAKAPKAAKSRAIPTPPATTLPALPSASLPTVAAPAENPTPRRPAPVVGRSPCCWPIGEPRQPGFRFCGDRALAGKSYCLTHHRVAYLRPSQVSGWLRDAAKAPKSYVGPRTVTVR